VAVCSKYGDSVDKDIYGDEFDRCKNFPLSKMWLELTNYEDFASTILEAIGAFFEGKSPSDVRMQYRDDENTFIPWLVSGQQTMPFQDKMYAPCWTLTFLIDHESRFQDSRNYL